MGAPAYGEDVYSLLCPGRGQEAGLVLFIPWEAADVTLVWTCKKREKEGFRGVTGGMAGSSSAASLDPPPSMIQASMDDQRGHHLAGAPK